MKITATRRLQFAIGHRVFQHESKCAHFHGHNFTFLLSAESIVAAGPNGLDALGRVMDFGELKDRLGTWIESRWDHGFIVSIDDEEAQAALRMIRGQKTFVLPYNPTAENLARFLLEQIGPEILVGTNVRLTKVVVHETENNIAEADALA